MSAQREEFLAIKSARLTARCGRDARGPSEELEWLIISLGMISVGVLVVAVAISARRRFSSQVGP